MTGKSIFSSGVNQPGRIADDSSTSGSELKNEWSFFSPSRFPCVFKVCTNKIITTSLPHYLRNV